MADRIYDVLSVMRLLLIFRTFESVDAAVQYVTTHSIGEVTLETELEPDGERAWIDGSNPRGCDCGIV